MKILYALQGTGYGHISRATELIPLLKSKCDCDILISGYTGNAALPFEVNYAFRGFTFYTNANGSVDFTRTLKGLSIKSILKSIWTLQQTKYDLIISDFEPISAYTALLTHTKCIELSHQSSVLKSKCPLPGSRFEQLSYKLLFKLICPSKHAIGFHFTSIDNKTFTPIIRNTVRKIRPTSGTHITVYLPGFDPFLLKSFFEKNSELEFHIYSSEIKENVNCGNISLFKSDLTGFTSSLSTSHAVICGAGFETPAEALFLGKKLICIPMKSQYEQACNAAFLKNLGIRIEYELEALYDLDNWLVKAPVISFDYPEITDILLESILNSVKPQKNKHNSIDQLSHQLYVREY